MTLKSIKNENIEVINSDQFTAEGGEKNSRQQICKMKEEILLTPAELDQHKIIYAGCKDYNTLNDYRELRTKLLKRDNRHNFICMLSAINLAGGASHITINLAASIALDHSKTALIIDCHTDGSGVSNYLKKQATMGLTNFLAQDTDDLEEIIQQSGIPRVRIIPAGIRTEHAAEYFSSEKMELFIRTIKQRYPDRFILLDTPPIELYAESQILASLCDFTILVVDYAKATSAQIQTGIDIIGSDKLAGLIFKR